MISAMSLSSVAKDIEGQLVGDAIFSQVCTDTRTLVENSLFVALSGDNFNGNQFVAQAFAKGAVAAIVSETPSVDIPHLKVADTRKALGLIARKNRRLFEGPVLALTGSAGKTTCKEMLAAILQQLGSVLATKGNLNNEIGVPLTLLSIEPQHQYAVIEMGASQKGDISYLCQFAEPNVSVLTIALPAHILTFGSLQTVAATKGEIFEGLGSDGVAVINMDSPFAEEWREQAGSSRVLGFSVHDKAADLYARDIILHSAKGLQFLLCYKDEQITINLSLLGAHNITNALAASAASLALGVELKTIKAGLESVQAVSGRLKLHKTRDGRCLIDDSYNANPSAVMAAIETLSGFDGSTCLVLGNMAELGEQAESLHREVGHFAMEKGITQLLVIGEWAGAVADGFGDAALVFTNMDTLLSDCEGLITSDVILIKGSRSAGMERVVNKLMAAGRET